MVHSRILVKIVVSVSSLKTCNFSRLVSSKESRDIVDGSVHVYECSLNVFSEESIM